MSSDELCVLLDSSDVIKKNAIKFTTSYEQRPPHPATSKSYECYLCRDPVRTYTKMHNLVKHMRNHITAPSDRILFPCTKCDMHFNQVAYLWRHISTTHVDGKPTLLHECHLCGKKIHRKSVELHMRIHDGQRPFECHRCDKTFSSSSNLKSHMWQHSESKQYQCNLCDRSFIRIGRLKDHLRTHIQDKSFQCAICDLAFTNSYSLTTHNKQTHANETTSILFYDLRTGKVLN